jgi:hypothetical protein
MSQFSNPSGSINFYQSNREQDPMAQTFRENENPFNLSRTAKQVGLFEMAENELEAEPEANS